MSLINLSAYWILWGMFLVVDYTVNMQCSIFSKSFLLPLYKINLPSPHWNQNFLTCHNEFLTKIFLPYFGRWDANVMTLPNQLAPKQITNLQKNPAWLQNSAKTFIKRHFSMTSDLGLRKQKSIRKISDWVETYASAQSLNLRFI